MEGLQLGSIDQPFALAEFLQVIQGLARSDDGVTVAKSHTDLPFEGIPSLHQPFMILELLFEGFIHFQDIGRLELLEGNKFDPGRLLELGVIKKLGTGLKVLGSGGLTRGITVYAHVFSKSALEKIQKAGGSGTVIGSES